MCFGRPYESYTIPPNKVRIRNLLGVYCLAPYYADLNVKDDAAIYFNSYGMSNPGKSTAVFEKVRHDMKFFYDVSFSPVFVIKVTWHQVLAYNSEDDDEVSSSFGFLHIRGWHCFTYGYLCCSFKNVIQMNIGLTYLHGAKR